MAKSRKANSFQSLLESNCMAGHSIKRLDAKQTVDFVAPCLDKIKAECSEIVESLDHTIYTHSEMRNIVRSILSAKNTLSRISNLVNFGRDARGMIRYERSI